MVRLFEIKKSKISPPGGEGERGHPLPTPLALGLTRKNAITESAGRSFKLLKQSSRSSFLQRRAFSQQYLSVVSSSVHL